MADKIETIDGSLIQHSHHNDRIYLMHLHGANAVHLVSKLDRMAWAHGYGKIFAKIPATHWKAFKSAGYTREAIIPGFFRGSRGPVHRQILFWAKGKGHAAATRLSARAPFSRTPSRRKVHTAGGGMHGIGCRGDGRALPPGV